TTTMHHLSLCPRREPGISTGSRGCQDLVRFFALLRIKPHAPPLVRVPVNSFEFQPCGRTPQAEDRKSTRLNSSHVSISYAVFCLKKKKSRSIMLTNYTQREAQAVRV